jgi:hypothetical protein
MSKHSRRHASLLHAALGATALTAALVGPAPGNAANVTMATVCRNYPCVFDQDGRGQVLGYARFQGEAIREETSGPGAGQWYTISYLKTGVKKSAVLYYNTTNCTDQPYMEYSGEVPQNAQYDGQSLWAAIGEIQTFTWNARSYYDNTTGTIKCVPLAPYPCYGGVYESHPPPCTGTGAPAVKIETKTWTPPLSFSPLDE